MKNYINIEGKKIYLTAEQVDEGEVSGVLRCLEKPRFPRELRRPGKRHGQGNQ